MFAVQWGRRAEGFPLEGNYLVIFDRQCKMLPRCPGGKVEQAARYLSLVFRQETQVTVINWGVTSIWILFKTMRPHRSPPVESVWRERQHSGSGRRLSQQRRLRGSQ